MRIFLIILLSMTVSIYHGQVNDTLQKIKSAVLPKYTLNFSYGFPDIESISIRDKVSFPSYNVTSLGPLLARLDLKIAGDAMIGLTYGYSSTSININAKPEASIFLIRVNSIGVRYSQYFIRKNKFDFYAGIGGGLSFTRFDATKMKIAYTNTLKLSPYYFDIIAGLKYKLTEDFHFFMDVGIVRYSVLQIGVCIVFN